MIKSKHRVISLFLVVMLVVTALFTSTMSVSAVTVEESTASAGGNVVYFQNTANWGSVKIHYWGGSNQTTWPGVDMSLVSGTTDIYSYEIPAGHTGIVFNNGSGAQTGDLTVADGTGKVFVLSSNSWQAYTGPTNPTDPTTSDDTTPTTPTTPTTSTTPTTPAGENIVYFKNTKGWSTVNAYMWVNGTEENNATWPGKAMTNLGDDIWCYEVPDSKFNMIIFNDGGSQTDNLTYPGSGQIYDGSKWEVYDTNALRITSFTTDLTSPQYTGMDITISAEAKNGTETVTYKFTVKNDSTGASTVLSNGYANSVIWNPSAVGTYTITLDVTDTAGNANQRTMSYTVADASTLVKPIIKTVNPVNNSQIKVNTTATVKVNAGGGNTGTKLLFYKYVVTNPDGSQNTPYYSLSQTYTLQATQLGTYKVQVFVQGSDNQTVNKTYTYEVKTTVDDTTAPTTSTDPENPSDYQLGDVDKSGDLTIRDATLVQSAIARYETLTAEQIALADYDKSGTLEIRDATFIQMKVAKLL